METIKRFLGCLYLIFLCTLGGPLDAIWYRWKFGRWHWVVVSPLRGEPSAHSADSTEEGKRLL